MSAVYKASFTDRLRTRAQALAGTCPTCGQSRASSREVAVQVGTSNTTMWRFLKGGKPSAELVDKLVDWLDEHESPRMTEDVGGG